MEIDKLELLLESLKDNDDGETGVVTNWFVIDINSIKNHPPLEEPHHKLLIHNI
jgi:hypothetical protein